MFRTAAILALGFGLALTTWAHAGKEEDAAKYTKELKSSGNVKVKIEAATKIGELGQIKKSWAAEAVPYLIKACKDDDKKLRAAAAEALGKVDPPPESKAIETLIDLVKNDKELSVQQAAARGLGHMGPAAREAVPTLREAVSKIKNRRDARPFQDAMRTINAKR